jgi:hypothetical protein
MIYLDAFLVGFIAACVVELVQLIRAYREAKRHGVNYATQNGLPEV